MTLDPVHVEGIAALARRIGREVDDGEHEGFARTVWEEYLDPLRGDGRTLLEPVDDLARGAVDLEDVALCEAPFPTSHGLDSGTLNPTTYKNGIVLDVAQAAMGCVPTDLDCHRSRTIVATIHTGDEAVALSDDWETYDEGFGRRMVVKAPRVNRYAEGVVHALALYLAESEHAHRHAEEVEDLLVLDGPIYPKEVLSWRDRHPELADKLLDELLPRRVVERYLRLVETFVERDVPLAGFVKNPATKLITNAVRGRVPAPWVDDAALFVRLLECRDGDERVRDRLTYTNWFVSRGGADRTFARDGDALSFDRDLPPEAYEVTFFAIYDPRDDVCYRVEAPYAFTADPDLRADLRKQLLREVATERGPPLPVAKADELARIDAAEKESIRRKIEGEWDSDLVRTYDDVRWAGEEF